MRKLILRMLTSIDGFIADHGGDLRFGSRWSEEMQRLYVEPFDAGKRLPRRESTPAARPRRTPR